MTDLAIELPTAPPEVDVESLLYTPGVYKVTITPELARRLLDRNKKNRTRKDKAIIDYAEFMRRGKWRVTNQGLGFDRNGVLTDGQNRLYACVEADAPFETLLATGLADEARDVVDVGVKRSISDVLQMNGYTNTVQVGAAASLRIRYDHLVSIGGAYTAAGMRALGRNHEVLLEYVREHPAIADRAAPAGVVRAQFPKAPRSAICAFESLVVEGDPESLGDFRNAVLTGAMLAEGDPRLALRNFLTKLPERGSNRISMMVLGVFVKAWNDWKHGEERFVLALRENEPVPRFDAAPSVDVIGKRKRDRAKRASRQASQVADATP